MLLNGGDKKRLLEVMRGDIVKKYFGADFQEKVIVKKEREKGCETV